METLTAGVLLAGAAQAPKDIPDAVCQASAAASKTMELLSQPMLQRDPTTAEIDDTHCMGCFECLEVCAYGAIERNEIRDRQGAVVRVVARVNPAVCEGCGVCTVTCRNGNIDLRAAPTSRSSPSWALSARCPQVRREGRRIAMSNSPESARAD